MWKSRRRKDRERSPQTASVGEAHRFWRSPDDENDPSTYLLHRGRSEYLLEKVREHAVSDPRILEIGCNVGRNLNCLFQGGFRRLEAIEINPGAVKLLRETFPDMAAHAEIYNASVEDTIRKLPEARFDVIYSMAVLEHIHEDSSWTTRDRPHREGRAHHHGGRGRREPPPLPRNYREIFEPLGLRQLEERECNELFDITPEIVEKYGSRMVARVFRRE